MLNERVNARYRKIYPRLWPQLVGFDDKDKLICLYVLSGPQTNRVGLYKFSPGQAAEDLDTSPTRVTTGLETLAGKFQFIFDPPSRVLWVKSWWRWNPPENESVLIGALADLAEVPETPLYQQFSTWTDTLADKYRETFRTRVPARGGSRPPHQEQEQEQDQEQEKNLSLYEDPQRASQTLASPPPAIVMKFPIVGPLGPWWNFTEAHLADLRADFPTIDAMAEARKALAWLKANPTKRKTAKGMARFLANWFTKATDSPRRGAASPSGRADVDGVEETRRMVADRGYGRRK